MEYLFDAWPYISTRLAFRHGNRTSRSSQLPTPGTLLVLSDFDGTLAPIVPVPDYACLPPDTRDILQQLASREGYLLGIVSGRALADLKSRVAIDGLIYAGNYGLEMEGPWGNLVHPEAQAFRHTVETLHEHLKHRLNGIEHVVIEFKALSLSVHYRLTSPADHGRIKREIFGALKESQACKSMLVSPGKMVWELIPAVRWDKGNAIDYLLCKTPLIHGPVLPIFLGDDKCDEAGFAAVRRYDGISIFVGNIHEAQSMACYYLNGTNDVAEFLRRLLVFPEKDRLT